MRALGIIAFGALGWLGCTLPAPGFPEGADAGSDEAGDASPEVTGELAFDFKAKPGIPGAVSGDFQPTVLAARVDLSDVRAIGDSAPGDERTSVDELLLLWDIRVKPMRVSFPDAPPGIYSRLLARVDGYDITGTVVVGGATVELEIVDAPGSPMTLSIDLGQARLDDGSSLRIEVPFEADKILAAIDWDAIVPDADGVLRIDGQDDGIDEVRRRINEAFGAPGEDYGGED